jgi:hypothetical protein
MSRPTREARSITPNCRHPGNRQAIDCCRNHEFGVGDVGSRAQREVDSVAPFAPVWLPSAEESGPGGCQINPAPLHATYRSAGNLHETSHL